MGEKMFHNIPKNIVATGRVVRQKVMVTLARGGGNRGGKLSSPGLARHDFWCYFCTTRVAVTLASGHGLPVHCETFLSILNQCVIIFMSIPRL